MKTSQLRADCLAIVTDSNDTLWVRSDTSDIQSLCASLDVLRQNAKYQDATLYPIRSFTDEKGDEQVVELLGALVDHFAQAGEPGSPAIANPESLRVEVWHDANPTFGFAERGEVKSRKNYILRAYVRVVAPTQSPGQNSPNLQVVERVFTLTQNLGCAWHPKGVRSTSVGDVLVLTTPEGTWAYRVAFSGFDLIDFND